MPDVVKTTGGPQTGVASTLKVDAKNAASATKAEIAKQEAEVKAIKVEDGFVEYKTIGMNAFNSKEVSFKGSRYVTDDADEIDYLDNMVKRNLLIKGEDKRT